MATQKFKHDQNANVWTGTVSFDAGEPVEPSLLDQLITERSKIAIKAKSEVAKLDREIKCLRESDAENIVREAREALKAAQGA